MNFRCVTVFGTATEVVDPDEVRNALRPRSSTTSSPVDRGGARPRRWRSAAHPVRATADRRGVGQGAHGEVRPTRKPTSCSACGPVRCRSRSAPTRRFPTPGSPLRGPTGRRPVDGASAVDLDTPIGEHIPTDRLRPDQVVGHRTLRTPPRAQPGHDGPLRQHPEVDTDQLPHQRWDLADVERWDADPVDVIADVHDRIEHGLVGPDATTTPRGTDRRPTPCAAGLDRHLDAHRRTVDVTSSILGPPTQPRIEHVAARGKAARLGESARPPRRVRDPFPAACRSVVRRPTPPSRRDLPARRSGSHEPGASPTSAPKAHSAVRPVPTHPPRRPDPRTCLQAIDIPVHPGGETLVSPHVEGRPSKSTRSSSAAMKRSTPMSACCGPTTWRPIGMPSELRPTGTVPTGDRLRLNG